MTNYKRNTASTKKSICRARSAYNFFYKHQRSIILHEIQLSKNMKIQVQKEASSMLLPVENSENNNIRTLLLRTDNSESRKNRKHCKSHGMINLKQLTLKIAQRWREASQETKAIYQRLAKDDKMRYENELMSEILHELGPRSIEDMLFYDGVYAGLTSYDERYFLNILLKG